MPSFERGGIIKERSARCNHRRKERVRQNGSRVRQNGSRKPLLMPLSDGSSHPKDSPYRARTTSMQGPGQTSLSDKDLCSRSTEHPLAITGEQQHDYKPRGISGLAAALLGIGHERSGLRSRRGSCDDSYGGGSRRSSCDYRPRRNSLAGLHARRDSLPGAPRPCGTN